MSEVRRHLNKNIEFSISSLQQNLIYDWCIKSIEKIDYDRIILVRENHNYSVFLDYYVCKNIYAFQKKFDFELPQKFYSKTLKYCDLESFANKENQFDFIMKKIDNKGCF
jgi:hypothetical protein